MEGCLMSLGVFQSPDLVDAVEKKAVSRERRVSLKACKWNPDDFAREQIWGLIRQVFFASLASPVRQIVLAAVEPGTDVARICRQIGEALALETSRGVAVVGRGPENYQALGMDRDRAGPGIEESTTPLLEVATQVRSNLWLLPQSNILTAGAGAPNLHGRLAKLRREFEYSIVEGPPAAESSEAAVLGRSADGIILVVEAHRTRRAAARKIQRTLDAAGSRVLGLVLTGRRFPIPDGIYRRL
jgi:hypothetical protein